MECPSCNKEYDDAVEYLPNDQEERVLFRCRHCGSYFHGWWVVEHKAVKLSRDEAMLDEDYERARSNYDGD